MKDFKSIIRDTLPINNPSGTWQWGKNFLLTKGHKSISNEDGLKFQYLVKGTVIGFIATNAHVVYFHKNDTGTDEIGVVNTNNDAPVYTTVIKDNQLNFQLNCPIEGIFIYNYKGDLIVSWCDGVKPNSNPPRVLNTTTLPFAVNGDGTLVTPTDIFIININPNLHQGSLSIDYLDFGEFGGFAVYITFSYVYNDDSNAGYFSSSDIAYVGIDVNPTLQRGFTLNFTDLDLSFSRLRIGLTVRTEEEGEVASALIGYESEILNYTGTTFTIDVTSLSNFAEVSAEAILLEQAYFEKANTITKYDNQSILANVETAPQFEFQKYANMLNVVPVEYVEETNTNYKGQDASFMPDEVYALYIELQLLNGSYTEAFHIPGRVAEGTETDVLTAGQKTQYDLTWTDLETGFKQFHVFNNGIAASMTQPTGGSPNPVPADESGNKMGYWENAETYPNDDEYDSTLDYDNNALGGSDLRNTPIRYHRFPSIKSMYDSSLTTGGIAYTEASDDRWGMASGASTSTPSGNPYGHSINTNWVNRKYGIKITNIATIIPAPILSQIQGYRISHVSRTSNNSFLAGNWVAVRRHDHDDLADAGGDGLGDTDSGFEYYNFGTTNQGVDDPQIRFDKVRLLGNELFKFRPSLQPLFIQTNYKFRLIDYTEDTVLSTYVAIENGDGGLFNEGFVIPDVDRYSKCESGLIYRPHNSAIENTDHHEEGVNLNLKADYLGQNIIDTFPGGTPWSNDLMYACRLVLNITAYAFKLNVYTGFKSDDLNIVGRISTIADNTVFKGGDNFTESAININARGLHRVYDYVLVRRWHVSLPIQVRGLNSPVNGAQLYNTPPDDRTDQSAGVLDLLDYDFDIRGKETLSSIQNVITIFTFDLESDFINKFPFRVYRGLKLPNESLTIEAIGTYLASDYYEMPNDKGEILAVRGKERALFIQHRFTLFAALVKDKLKTENVDAYLGTSELFDRPPEELLSDDKGYIGSTSKFACIIVKGMYITVNQVNGQIFIIQNDVKEISAKGVKRWFWDNWDNGLDYYDLDDVGEKRRIDNPFISVGHLVGYDKEYNRLLFIKKMYNFIGSPTGTTFDGEFYTRSGNKLEFSDTNEFENVSKTLSFNLETQNLSWICEHDYHPNLIFYTSSGLFSITNKLLGVDRASVYEHNDKLTKGLYYGVKYDTYVDLIFNEQSQLSRLLQNVTWITDVINNAGGNELYKTITHIMIYNNNQCSGIINLKDNHFELTRNAEGDWNFNEFRDLVINPNNPILDANGDIITANINNLTLWFEKSNFIGKFITVRLIIDNIDNDTVHIHQVNTQSVISNR